MSKQYIVISGNLVHGMTFHGPFDNYPDAADWSERTIEGCWAIGEVKPAKKASNTKAHKSHPTPDDIREALVGIRKSDHPMAYKVLNYYFHLEVFNKSVE